MNAPGVGNIAQDDPLDPITQTAEGGSQNEAVAKLAELKKEYEALSAKMLKTIEKDTNFERQERNKKCLAVVYKKCFGGATSEELLAQ